MRILISLIILFFVFGILYVKSAKSSKTNLKITSDSFSDGNFLNKKYTGLGEDISPHIKWENLPKKTKSIAIICDDPDAPVGNWVHWVIFNIAPSVNEITENLPKQPNVLESAVQGKNDFRKTGYNGPYPPPGKPHRYFFKVYALDTMLNLEAETTKPDLVNVMEEHILAEGEIMGKFQR